MTGRPCGCGRARREKGAPISAVARAHRKAWLPNSRRAQVGQQQQEGAAKGTEGQDPAIICAYDEAGDMWHDEADKGDGSGERDRTAGEHHDERDCYSRQSRGRCPSDFATSPPRLSVVNWARSSNETARAARMNGAIAATCRALAAMETIRQPEADLIEVDWSKISMAVVSEDRNAVSTAPASTSFTGVAPDRPADPSRKTTSVAIPCHRAHSRLERCPAVRRQRRGADDAEGCTRIDAEQLRRAAK